MNDLDNWKGCERPTNAAIKGRYIDIEPWNREHHGHELWESFGGMATNDLLFHFGWAEMNDAHDLADHLDGFNQRGEFATCIFVAKETGKAVGMASYMSFVEQHGVVETGAIAHGAALAKTRGATEGHYLMARRVFDLGYRRYEWKLNDPNKMSHAAARRFGFTFEGVFRQHKVMPYGNRDTAWYSMLDHEWPSRKRAFEAWLSPDNFDEGGRQIKRLEAFRSEA